MPANMMTPAEHAKVQAFHLDVFETIKSLLASVPPSVWQAAESKGLELATTVLQGLELAIPASPGGFLVHAGEKSAAESLLQAIARVQSQLQAEINAAPAAQ